MNTYTHKGTGWTRAAEGYGVYTITPTDDSGARSVKFLSPGTWQNDPGDEKANVNTARVILLAGAPLPAWALDWLTKANEKACGIARERFAAMLHDADMHAASRDGW